MPRRPARPVSWVYSPAVMLTWASPLNLSSFSSTTQRAGIFTPRASVSVAKTALTSPSTNSFSTTSLKVGSMPAWCAASPRSRPSRQLQKPSTSRSSEGMSWAASSTRRAMICCSASLVSQSPAATHWATAASQPAREKMKVMAGRRSCRSRLAMTCGRLAFRTGLRWAPCGSSRWLRCCRRWFRPPWPKRPRKFIWLSARAMDSSSGLTSKPARPGASEVTAAARPPTTASATASADASLALVSLAVAPLALVPLAVAPPGRAISSKLVSPANRSTIFRPTMTCCHSGTGRCSETITSVCPRTVSSHAPNSSALETVALRDATWTSLGRWIMTSSHTAPRKRSAR
ncbi:hypothetical protein SRABI128_05561 [Microbacterium sp. Bi128]|nr:hypothetical protein SRABI128_05561 [Microbacterium sp. Bi128]